MYLKVMVSPYYNGGAWEDEKTKASFDPKLDAGKVISIPRMMDTSGIMEAVRKNYLMLVDATQEEHDAPAIPLTAPSIIQVSGKHMSLELSFDRVVFPAQGKNVFVPTKDGEVVLKATEAYMEAYTTAVFYVDAIGPIRVEEGAFVDEAGLGTQVYGTEVAPEPPVEPEQPEEETEEPVVEAKTVKATARKKTVKKD